ncbi:hypothetical protein BCR44DRAFT_1425512 [Catenaria anguillulae PL171]|uniref:Uncharacterized protein n=1 Tax=Catenaria anguillulae PL171 TaxID=765915 RepID=A0A1Y2HYP0_9FUNG|nr:hypothetical protein BCR44DRAFT_1425512 [Catenaria anguillulae PL171]
MGLSRKARHLTPSPAVSLLWPSRPRTRLKSQPLMLNALSTLSTQRRLSQWTTPASSKDGFRLLGSTPSSLPHGPTLFRSWTMP